MRAVLQRVRHASVTVDGEQVGRIGPGLLVFLGVGRDDTDEDLSWIVGRIAHLRIFEDDEGRMNRSVIEAAGAVLLVSQFTLYGDCRRGRRPGFTQAMAPEQARVVIDQAVERLRDLGLPVETGVFGADMQVELGNDGPVTMLLDSTRQF